MLTNIIEGDTIMIQTNNRGVIMLKRFEVENFKGFNKRMVFDLTARDYAFNKTIVVNEIVNKAIVYGKNGVGKSSLGVALFDIIGHLTDKERMPFIYTNNYLNLDSPKQYAVFKYVFRFDDDILEYEYAKHDPNNLIYEKLTINQTTVINYDFFNPEQRLLDKTIIERY